ncbi:CYTH domain-containing protein [Aphelenchoides besseyi]|nr:CYTH domain-containing protein [Aphelenchoides besseyi]
MPRNVEIKAKIEDLDSMLASGRRLCSGAEPQVIRQHDTFFVSKTGRLKLREFPGDEEKRAELIYYDRPDESGPKLSDYIKTETADPQGLKSLLSVTNGMKGEVKKVRYLFLYGQTRIHIDNVEGLGSYMELEVCLKDDETLDYGVQLANEIREKLNVPEENLVTGAYFDALS